MISRRNFLKLTSSAAAMISVNKLRGIESLSIKENPVKKPIVLSTWKHGLLANQRAWLLLSKNSPAIDAVEAGAMVTEADFTNLSVGLGGLPDRDGHVTLDASIMDEKGRCGAVAFIRRIKHPICVARKVMELTPHVLIVGEGAQRFAVENGFELEPELLSLEAQKRYNEWLKKSEYKPIINIENHDTIGMIALDANGNLSGSCTTSGLAYKIHGRVGDSPIIGAGLYVDNEVGAACATGVGEAVIRMSGSFLVVEFMRQGFSPSDACKKAIERLIDKNPNYKDLQVGFLALNKKGEHGAFAVQKGFNYALNSPSVENQLIDSLSYL